MGKLSFQMRPTLNDKLSYPSITYLTDLKIKNHPSYFTYSNEQDPDLV